MPEVMPTEQWIKLTDAGFTKPRSNELKAIDEALKKYHMASNQANLVGVQGALTKWMQKEGNGWKNSVRNKRNAVDTLFKQINGMGSTVPKTGAGMVAISYARDESRAIITDLFAGKRLQFRSGIMAKIAGPKITTQLTTGYRAVTIVKDSYKLKKDLSSGSSSSNPGKARELANSLLSELAPHEHLEEIKLALEHVVPGFMQQLATSLTPWVGVISSGATSVVAGAKVLKAQWNIHETNVHLQRSLAVDDPEKAMQAMIRLLERERNTQAAGLAIGVAEFGGKLAGVLADGGTATNTAVGLAGAVAKMVVLIHAIIIDVKEKNAANILMAQKIVDARVFQASPVMGAYMVCCAPTSVLCNSIFDNFYQQTMQDVVERAVERHIVPLRETARKLVNDHRMYIPELQNFAGVLETNKKNLKEMQGNIGKGKYSVDHLSSDDFPQTRGRSNAITGR